LKCERQLFVLENKSNHKPPLIKSLVTSGHR
jgi:hypothetical protein